MRNKKGFTLVELLVSMVLLSIVIVFMSNFVLSIRDREETAGINIELMVAQASLSKTINTDANNKGISSINCESDIKCSITFLDSSVKIIEIVNGGKSVKYYDNDKVYLVRTIKSDIYTTMVYTTETLTEGIFHKLVINLSEEEDYKIEIYDYVKTS